MTFRNFLDKTQQAYRIFCKKHDFNMQQYHQEDLINKSLVLEKIDKKPHLTTFIPLGVNEEKINIAITTNLTSKERINVDNYTKIISETKYTFDTQVKSSKIQYSYETPYILIPLDEKTINNLKVTFYSKDDFRYFMEENMYPDVVVNKLCNKQNLESIFLDKYDRKTVKLHKIFTNDTALNSIINISEKEGITVNKDILEYNKITNKINESISFEESVAIESVRLTQKLINDFKLPIIKKYNNQKIYKIYDINELVKNKILLRDVSIDFNKSIDLGIDAVTKYNCWI